MNQKHSIYLIIGAALAFTVYELIGHWFLMAVPMGVRHGVSILVGTALALLVASVSIQAIWRQQGELRELAHLRDYLMMMQAHYLRLSPSERRDPEQQLEYQALELQYAGIQHNLAADSSTVRARALLDLSELAQTHLPSMEASYPFFPHAASHIAAALYLEADSLVRDEALHSLKTLAAFSSENAPVLLPLLIDNLAHANRTACSTLVEALAVYVVRMAGTEDAALTSLQPHVRFTSSVDTDTMVLRELVTSPACREAIVAVRILQNADKTPQPEGDSALKTVGLAAIALRDTRDALAHALRALPPPTDFPPEPLDHRFWKRAHPIILQDAFLTGAELNRAQMQGIDLQRASLQAAALTDAHLQNADMTGANLRKALLVTAGLEYAKLWGANLRDASLPAARLQGADLSRAHLQGAHLTGAHLKGACLWQISIADDEHLMEHRAVFGDANWWDARFTDGLTGSTDRDLQRWLKYAYPQPTTDADTIAKVPDNAFIHAQNTHA